MSQSALFAPMLTTMLLTLVVWIYMYARRIPFIQRSKLQPNQLTSAELTRLSPPEVLNPSENLKNLFEMPTIFYGVVLYLYVTSQVDGVYLLAAWVFAIFRILHSAVHCTINIVILRFWLYFVASIAMWFMLVRAALAAFGAGGA